MGAENRRKDVGSMLGFLIRRLENSVNRAFLESVGDKAVKGELWNPPFISCAQDYSLDELINFWTYSVTFRMSYSPFLDTGILYWNNLVNKISE